MDTLTTADRWHDWLHRAKERAATMEAIAPLAADRKPRRGRVAEPQPGGVDCWYEPSPWKSPVQDAPNLVTLDPWAFLARRVASTQARKKKRASTAKVA